MFKTESEVATILQEHYLHSALGQVYKIVGYVSDAALSLLFGPGWYLSCVSYLIPLNLRSLELVGNPIGLVSSLGVGVRDFFYEPAHALLSNPTEIRKIGKSVVKGAISVSM
jgi:hypothetical protein